MDLTSVIGLLLGFVAVFGAFLFEGGKLEAVLQPTAAVIIGGGTIATLCVQYPGAFLIAALKGLKIVFLPPKHNMGELVTSLVSYAQKARREGIVALEADASGSKEAFLKKALGLAVDGTESRLIREAMEIEMQILAEEGEMAPKVWEAAGGFAPTVGILGAVLGLIQVMANINDPAKLGSGIAVAFVATVYGVFLANIICLPMGGKLKLRHAAEMVKYELILTGVLGIVDGENPRIIEQKLQGYLGAHGAKPGKGH